MARRQHLFVDGERAFGQRLGLGVVGLTPIVIRQGVSRLKFDGLVVVGDRPLELTLLFVGITPVVVGPGSVGIAPDDVGTSSQSQVMILVLNTIFLRTRER